VFLTLEYYLLFLPGRTAVGCQSKILAPLSLAIFPAQQTNENEIDEEA